MEGVAIGLGALLIGWLLLRGRPEAGGIPGAPELRTRTNERLAVAQADYSVESNIAIVSGGASAGAGIGATLGGPVGFAVGAAIGWLVGLGALAFRGGIDLGAEFRQEVAKSLDRRGLPSNRKSVDFASIAALLWVNETYRFFVMADGSFGIQHGTFESVARGSDLTAEFVGSFWDEVKRRRTRGGTYDDDAERWAAGRKHLVLWTIDAWHIDDVPWLRTGGLRTREDRVTSNAEWSGLFRDDPEHFRMVLQKIGRQMGVQNESWFRPILNG